jgi:6-phosphofructokinase
LIGFINGVDGLYNEKFIKLENESYKNFRNLGGYDYIGRAADSLRSEEELA